MTASVNVHIHMAWLIQLHTPTQVKFVGEDGVDWGGIRKEFFMLLIEEVLNPIYGMFYEEEESKLIWFKDQV